MNDMSALNLQSLAKPQLAAEQLQAQQPAAQQQLIAPPDPVDQKLAKGIVQPPPAPVEPVEPQPAVVNPRLVDAVNQLAARIYDEVAEPGQSYFVSSASIAYALAMLTNGAESQLQSKMLTSMGLDDMSIAEANAGFKALAAGLLSNDGVQVNLANGIWSDPTVRPSEAFKRAVTEDFGAKVDVGDMREAVGEINAFCDEATHGMINHVLNDGDLDGAIMALVNAIYFKGKWTLPFNEHLTSTRKFTKADGAKVDVDMMYQRATVAAKKGVGFHAAKLPYGDEKTASMVVIVPENGRSVADVMKELASERGKAKYLEGYADLNGDIRLPKFDLDYDKELKNVLKGMGMPLDGPFTGIDPCATVSFVKHVAKCKVNEEGTEAAAVTVIGIERTSVPVPSTVLNANKPFVFMIMDEASGTAMFTGTFEGP